MGVHTCNYCIQIMLLVLATGVSMIAVENAVEDWIYKQTGASIEFDASESIAILEQVSSLNRLFLDCTTHHCKYLFSCSLDKKGVAT